MRDEDDTEKGMTPEPRFVDANRSASYGGPRGIGNLVPGVTRKVFRRQSPAAAQIVLDWEVIVGPKVASMTTPRKLERGVLTIACSGATAMNLHYVGIELINRINTHLGGQPVHSLRFTQAGMPRKSPAALTSPPEAMREAEAAVGEIPEGPLRSALVSLGRVVIGRTKHRTRWSGKPN